MYVWICVCLWGFKSIYIVRYSVCRHSAISVAIKIFVILWISEKRMYMSPCVYSNGSCKYILEIIFHKTKCIKLKVVASFWVWPSTPSFCVCVLKCPILTFVLVLGRSFSLSFCITIKTAQCFYIRTQLSREEIPFILILEHCFQMVILFNTTAEM